MGVVSLRWANGAVVRSVERPSVGRPSVGRPLRGLPLPPPAGRCGTVHVRQGSSALMTAAGAEYPLTKVRARAQSWMASHGLLMCSSAPSRVSARRRVMTTSSRVCCVVRPRVLPRVLPRVQLGLLAAHGHQRQEKDAAHLQRGEHDGAGADSAALPRQHGAVPAQPGAADDGDALLLGGQALRRGSRGRGWCSSGWRPVRGRSAGCRACAARRRHPAARRAVRACVSGSSGAIPLIDCLRGPVRGSKCQSSWALMCEVDQ